MNIYYPYPLNFDFSINLDFFRITNRQQHIYSPNLAIKGNLACLILSNKPFFSKIIINGRNPRWLPFLAATGSSINAFCVCRLSLCCLSSVTPFFRKFFNQSTSHLGLSFMRVRVRQGVIFKRIGLFLALWWPKKIYKNRPKLMPKLKFPSDKVKVSQAIDL